MILLNDFFHINDTRSSETEIWAEIFINADHPIFGGHFPHQPVVPGVCQLQMIKEIAEQVTGKVTNIREAADLKFLAVIDPRRNNLVNTSIALNETEAGLINITASIFKDELVHFKCKMKLETTA
jgi:3-hydroxyacyl-[acyl-carrier-protein] dehydratase